MGKHQIMSVPKEARGTFDCDMFATWVGANADNGTWFIGGVIVILSRPRGPDLESPVDKKEAFPPFFVCFRGRADRIWSRR